MGKFGDGSTWSVHEEEGYMDLEVGSGQGEEGNDVDTCQMIKATTKVTKLQRAKGLGENALCSMGNSSRRRSWLRTCMYDVLVVRSLKGTGSPIEIGDASHPSKIKRALTRRGSRAMGLCEPQDIGDEV